MECKAIGWAATKISVAGFNRNIVECKEAPQAGRGAGRSVLIETLWNVNNGDPDAGNALRVGFNRNIMECKEILIDEFNNNMLHFMKVRV